MPTYRNFRQVEVRIAFHLLEQPNKETIAAMLEAERIARDPSVKHYSDVEEALRHAHFIIKYQPHFQPLRIAQG